MPTKAELRKKMEAQAGKAVKRARKPMGSVKVGAKNAANLAAKGAKATGASATRIKTGKKLVQKAAGAALADEKKIANLKRKQQAEMRALMKEMKK